MAKFGMSMCVLGMHSEYKHFGIAFNALWPRTAIATAAVANHLGGEVMMAKSRTPEIMADAAYVIMNKDSTQFTGNSVLTMKCYPPRELLTLSNIKWIQILIQVIWFLIFLFRFVDASYQSKRKI